MPAPKLAGPCPAGRPWPSAAWGVAGRHGPLAPLLCPANVGQCRPWGPSRGRQTGGRRETRGPRGRGVRGADGVGGMAAARRAWLGPAWAAAVGLLGQAPAAKSRNLFVGLFSSDFSCVPSIQGFGSVAKLLLLVPGQMVENGSFHLGNFALSAAKNGGPRWWGNAIGLPHGRPTSQTRVNTPETPLADTTNRGCETVYENIYWLLYRVNFTWKYECRKPERLDHLVRIEVLPPSLTIISCELQYVHV